MMLPPITDVSAQSSSTSRVHAMDDESLTEDYGEPSDERRNLSGGVDFFSNMGTERKKKPIPNRADPDKVSSCS